MELGFPAQLVSCICSVSLNGNKDFFRNPVTAAVTEPHRSHTHGEGQGGEYLVPKAQARSDTSGRL